MFVFLIQLATIEEQQKALLQLKMNMLDELTEKGIMKNAQCKKVIETHQKVRTQTVNCVGAFAFFSSSEPQT